MKQLECVLIPDVPINIQTFQAFLRESEEGTEKRIFAWDLVIT